MAIKCSDFLVVSAHLAGIDDQHEIYQRSALGRAYYSVYHEALIKADKLGLPEPSAVGRMGEHKRLVARFAAGSKRLKVIAGMIDKIRIVRTTVDYTLDVSYSKEQAGKDIKLCRTVIDEIARL